MLKLKGSSRWVLLWNQPSGGHIQEGFICMWPSCKALNLTTEQAPPQLQIIPLYCLMTWRNHFFTIDFSSSTSIALDWRCPRDCKQLGKDILRCWGQGDEEKGERIKRGREEDDWVHASLPQHLSCLLLFNLSIVHVPPLISLAISQSQEGFSMWLAIFSSHQTPPL